MATSLTRLGLRTLSQMAGSSSLDRLKLSKPTEKVVQAGRASHLEIGRAHV